MSATNERGFGELGGDDRRGEIGAAVAVTVEGAPVLDLWAGFADPGRRRAWRPDTLANVFSATKGIVAIAGADLLRVRPPCCLPQGVES